MRKDKETAFAMRSEGKTYLQIHLELGVPKGTLSGWFRGVEWSEEMKQKNILLAAREARNRILKMNDTRSKKLRSYYKDAQIEAEREFDVFCSDPCFVAALMLYLGEGDNNGTPNRVKIANTNVSVLRIFLIFLRSHCKVPPERIRFWMLGYPDLNVKSCEKWWSDKLQIPLEQFQKTQVIQGRHKSKKLHFGVGNIIVADTRLKMKVRRWIELLCEKLEKEAGIV